MSALVEFILSVKDSPNKGIKDIFLYTTDTFLTSKGGQPRQQRTINQRNNVDINFCPSITRFTWSLCICNGNNASKMDHLSFLLGK